MPSSADTLPEFRDWSIAAVWLLHGVVYSDDGPTWDLVLSSRSRLDEYFSRLGLLLVIDEPEGFAFLRQLTEDEQPEGYERLPKLFRRSRLSYDATLLCVLLRDELRRFEDEDVHNERCVVATVALFEQWKMFFPSGSDEVRLRKGLETALRTLEDLKFIRKMTAEPEEWEIRRILKARLPAAELENLRGQLAASAVSRSEGESGS
ncbi:MAG TPA: DUF4194 domain-containing protein [Planctomycetaceae bacterium]|nr:DUF4194 domain-containing protein [Planctomycetaceae bacterium]